MIGYGREEVSLTAALTVRCDHEHRPQHPDPAERQRHETVFSLVKLVTEYLYYLEHYELLS